MSTQTESLTEELENPAKKMLPYSGFDGQYIRGERRPGRADRTLKDTDPYIGDVVTEIGLGDLSGLGEAHRTAKLVQPAWGECATGGEIRGPASMCGYEDKTPGEDCGLSDSRVGKHANQGEHGRRA